MGHVDKIVVDGESVHIDPQILFQRLVIIGNVRADIESTEDLLTYELSNYLTALFDEFGLMRTPTKSQLADALSPMNISTTIASPSFTVLDGGSLPHGQIHWKMNETYGIICTKCITLGKRLPNSTVVFDGYGTPSTKDSLTVHIKKGLLTNIPTK